MKQSNEFMAVKAFERVSRYYKDMGLELHDSFHNDEHYKKVWIKVMSNVDIDMLDEASKLWFIEDENEFEEKYKKHIEVIKYSQKIAEEIANEVYGWNLGM